MVAQHRQRFCRKHPLQDVQIGVHHAVVHRRGIKPMTGPDALFA